MCHVVNIFEDKYGWYAFDYKSPKRVSRSSELFGPYSTAEELSKQYLKWYESTMKMYATMLGVKSSGKKFSTTFTDKEVKILESMEGGKYDQGDFFERCPDIIKRIKIEEISKSKVPTWFDEMISSAKKNVIDKLFSGVMNIFESSSVMENSYSDFSSIDDLASFVSNIEEVPKEMDDTFKWPKDIFRDSIGNCVDVALFVHYYCNECHIPNKLIRLTLEYQHDGKGPVSRQSHVVCGYEIDGKWSILQNSGLEKLERNIYSVDSTSIDTTIKRFSEEYIPVLLGYLKSVKPDIVVRDAYYSILTDSAMQRFDDKYYGNKSSDKQSIISSLFNKVGKTALKSSVYKESLYPSVINESSTGYSDAKSVYDSLSDKDKKLVSPSGRFVDSPALVYRYVHKVDNAVAGFIDCYKYNGSSSISAFIVYAISLRFRGKGISKILLDKAVNG
jgi:hypothetical protein